LIEKRTPFVLNCSRVGLTGGLKTFSDEVMGAMVEAGLPCLAVVPTGYPVPDHVEAIFTPASLAGASNLSLLRPVKWLTYSWFDFPVAADQRILSTTHQVLPHHSKQIVTIHDLRPYFYPDTQIQRFYFHVMLPRALSKCDGILTVSESSRELIAEIYGISLDRIAVVPNAIRQPTSLRASFEPGHSPYLLAVGASWSHKNIESLLQQHRLWVSNYGLKIVAGDGPYRRFLTALAAKLGIATRVEFLSGICREQLDRLYDQCTALVYPSRMEGFGLPPLEAMARRRPAIVSDIPVFRELYGSHAIYVKVADEDSWEDAFHRLTTLDEAFFAGGQAHAQTYNRRRMGCALGAALSRFWSIENKLCAE
jgi:glycosyltransferase involved in cell wall biosynthesis